MNTGLIIEKSRLSKSLALDVENFLKERNLEQPEQIIMGKSYLDLSSMSVAEKKAFLFKKRQRDQELRKALLEKNRQQQIRAKEQAQAEITLLKEQAKQAYVKEQAQKAILKAKALQEKQAIRQQAIIVAKAEKAKLREKEKSDKAEKKKIESLLKQQKKEKEKLQRVCVKQLVLKNFRSWSKEHAIRKTNSMLKQDAIIRNEHEYPGYCLYHGKIIFQIIENRSICKLCTDNKAHLLKQANLNRLSDDEKLQRKKILELKEYNRKNMIQAIENGHNKFLGSCVKHGQTHFFVRRNKKVAQGYVPCCFKCKNPHALELDHAFIQKRQNEIENYRLRNKRRALIHQNAIDRGLSRTTFFCVNHGVTTFRVYRARLRCNDCRVNEYSETKQDLKLALEQPKNAILRVDNCQLAKQAIKNGEFQFNGSCKKHGLNTLRVISKNKYEKFNKILTYCSICRVDNRKKNYQLLLNRNLSNPAHQYFCDFYNKYGKAWRDSIIIELGINYNIFKNTLHGGNSITKERYERIVKFNQNKGFFI